MKAGRNDPCPCGNGRKYKHCCAAKFDDAAHQRVAAERGVPDAAETGRLVALFDSGRDAEVESYSRSLLERFPDSGFVWKALGLSLQMQGKAALHALSRAAQLLPGDAELLGKLGTANQADRNFVGAVMCYRRSLQINPGNAEVHNNLSVALQALGQHEEAVTSSGRALAINSGYSRAHMNLGVALHALGKLEPAVTSYMRALAIKPDDAATHNNLGLALQSVGRVEDSVSSFGKAVDIDPSSADAHNNLGNALQALGRRNDALACCTRALILRPGFAKAHNTLGVVWHDLGRTEDAVIHYRKALVIDPDFAEAHNNLGNALRTLGQLDEAAASCRQALAIEPDLAEAHNSLGNALVDLGRLEDAANSYARAIFIKSDYEMAHHNLGAVCEGMGRLVEAAECYLKAYEFGLVGDKLLGALMLPPIMGALTDVMQSRADFACNLEQLMEFPLCIADPLTQTGRTNFYLAYHGLNDRDLQLKLAKLYEKACPSLLYQAPHCVHPRSSTRTKMRVGFLSKFVHIHSVSRCFSGVVEGLASRNDSYDVVLISSVMDRVRRADGYGDFTGARVYLPMNLEKAREQVAALELDVLCYLDIGMEPFSYFMAFSRLAPVQCVLSGHPVTTGIRNMDYFLSTSSMEIDSAQDHYSEELKLFSREIAYFERPALPTTFKSRLELGFPASGHIYMCPMRLQKIHPDFDEAIERILQLDKDGVLILFQDVEVLTWHTMLMRRFEKTISAGVRDRIFFVPWIRNYPDFISANRVADVVLDPFHFGIGSTIIATFAVGTPVVTKPSAFLRGRMAHGYCEMLGLRECVAPDTEEYARLAVEIAAGGSLRSSIKEKILANNHILYQNLEPLEELCDFFREAVGVRP